MPLTITIDARALQDDDYAQKGIGQHTAHVVSVLRSLPDVQLHPLADPMLGPFRRDVEGMFDAPPRWIEAIEGEVYLNPSPLTHDTAAFLTARRRGMRSCAVVHDFIPMRQAEVQADPERAAAYQYLVATLGKYDALLANSQFTANEIKRFLPNYAGRVMVLHCASRFTSRAAGRALAGQMRPALLKQLGSVGPYVFVATADDPRKNPDIALRAALEFRALGLKLVIGGGLSEATRKRLVTSFPAQSVLAEAVFLPRLTDAELAEIYLNARLVLVPSLDEGFSLPVAEAIGLGCRVVASRIPAHTEQITDPALLFAPEDAGELISAVTHGLDFRTQPGEEQYVAFDYAAERSALAAFLTAEPARRRAVSPPALTIVGPGFDRPTGIAVYNSMMIAQLRDSGLYFDYVDVDNMEPAQFYPWLFAHQEFPILYVMGNNNLFHSHCFVAMQNVPGHCILHDSRLFEFLLNRFGPYYILRLWQQRRPGQPITVDTVVGWQRERRRLPDSFLDPIVTRSHLLFVHSRISAEHIRRTYEFARVHYLPFALQMTQREVTYVVDTRAARSGAKREALQLVMLGETEPTKGCVELVFALKLLLLQGFDAQLDFAGRSEGEFHEELTRAVDTLGLAGRVGFASYLTRQSYLDKLSGADIVVQLRYPMYGQVSGPLADAVACGIPVVTTEDLALGTDVQSCCEVITNRFSPLHVAEGVRRLVERGLDSTEGRSASMAAYAEKLLEICRRADA